MCLRTNRRTDPTHTTAERKKAVSEINAKWRKIRGEVRKKIKDLPDNPTAEDLDEFNAWFYALIVLTLWSDKNAYGFTTTRSEDQIPSWMEKYLSRAFKKGGRQAVTSAKKAGYKTDEDPDILMEIRGEDRFKNVVSRTLLAMLSAVAVTSQKVQSLLMDSIEAGESKIFMLGQINSTIRKTGENRFRTIARTEIVRSHYKATLTVFEYLGVVEVGVTPEAAVLTAGDDKVCELCEAEAEKPPRKLSEIENLIPIHPECRCTVFVVS